MRRLPYGVMFVVMWGVGAAIAQETKPPAPVPDPHPVAQAPTTADDKPPVITNEIRLEIKDRIKTAQEALELTSPRAVGELVEQIMAARQQAVVAAQNNVNTYLASITKGDYVVRIVDQNKPETWVYEKRADIKK